MKVSHERLIQIATSPTAEPEKRYLAEMCLAQLEVLDSVQQSYVLCTGSHQETKEMKRARTLVGLALEGYREIEDKGLHAQHYGGRAVRP